MGRSFQFGADRLEYGKEFFEIAKDGRFLVSEDSAHHEIGSTERKDMGNSPMRISDHVRRHVSKNETNNFERVC